MSLACLMFGHESEEVDEVEGFPILTEYTCTRCNARGLKVKSGATSGGRKKIHWV